MIEKSYIRICPVCGERIAVDSGEVPGWDYRMEMCEYCAEDQREDE